MKAEEVRSALIHDSPVIHQKGHPRSARLTGAIEGRPWGGGPSARNRVQPPSATQRARRKCGLCRREGHTRLNCDWI